MESNFEGVVAMNLMNLTDSLSYKTILIFEWQESMMTSNFVSSIACTYVHVRRSLLETIVRPSKFSVNNMIAYVPQAC